MKTKGTTAFSKRLFLFFLIILSLFAAALVYFPTQQFKIGISPDSIQYIGTARNLVTGFGFTSYNGLPLLLYPPFYSVALAFLGWVFRTDPLFLANFLNSILFGFTVFLSGLLAYELTQKSFVFSLLSVIAITFSIPLYDVTTMAWSETLFIFLSLLFVFSSKFYSRTHSFSSLALIALISALASLTRYIGIFLIILGTINVLRIPEMKIKKKGEQLIFFIVLSSLPMIIWVIRNFVISGTLTGMRQISQYTLVENLHAIILNVFKWYFPVQVASRQFRAIEIIGIVILTILLIDNYYRMGKPKLNKLFSPLQIDLILFILLYIILLLSTSKTGFWQLIDNRYLSPVFIPLTLLLLSWAQSITVNFTKYFSLKIFLPFMSLFFLLLLLHPINTTLRNTKELAHFRLGFNTQSYLRSETINFLLAHPSIADECTIYTNQPIELDLIVYIPAKASPSKSTNDITSIVTDDVTKLSDLWPNSQSCLVWFTSSEKNDFFSINDLQKIVNLKIQYSFNDGTIYTIEKKQQIY